MAQRFPGEPDRSQGSQWRHRLDVDIPTIKILLYSDDPFEVTETSSIDRHLSLGLMLARLRSHAPASARISTKYVCRFGQNNPNILNKLDAVLDNEVRQTGEPFDEIWFFGIHQVNLRSFSPSFFQGGPNNELDEAEVRALENWMKADEANGFPGGGVLITGDHSSGLPDMADPGTNRLCPDTSGVATPLGLGRALGRCIPRAGKLRRWQGQPTSDAGDLFNTIENPGDEFDETAQRVILRSVNEIGEPNPAGGPHPLFYYSREQAITNFPDHRHEGALEIPEIFDPVEWPAGIDQQPRPLPTVVAHGINQRTTQFIDLVATYHGDLAGVGRIVADSTWHHYVNSNLRGFPEPAMPGTAADQIGQFYGNLAVWLAPTAKRRKMAHAICWRLANHTMRLDRRTEDPEPEVTLGRVAYSLLAQTASRCEIHELLQVLTPKRYGALPFPEGTWVLSDVPSRELLLGSIMCEWHEEMLRADRDEAYEPGQIDQVMANGFNRAFRKQVAELEQTREAAIRFLAPQEA